MLINYVLEGIDFPEISPDIDLFHRVIDNLCPPATAVIYKDLWEDYNGVRSPSVPHKLCVQSRV